MKKIFRLFALASFLAGSIESSAQQATVSLGDARIISNSPTLYECDRDGSLPRNQQSIPDGAGFNIVNQSGDNYVVSFWDWEVNDTFRKHAKTGQLTASETLLATYGQETNEQKLIRLNYTANNLNRYFLLPKGDIEVASDPLYDRWAPVLGTLSYLFKYRPSSGVFENAFNLSITGGFRCLIDKTNPNHSIALTGGVGVTTIPGASKSDGDSSNITGGGITFSGNIIYVWDRLQVGLSTGVDVPVGEGVKDWKYTGKPWISFGIGLNIFNEDKPSQKSGTNSN